MSTQSVEEDFAETLASRINMLLTVSATNRAAKLVPKAVACQSKPGADCAAAMAQVEDWAQILAALYLATFPIG